MDRSKPISLRRFPGLRPYRAEEQSLFFGRERESENLFLSVLGNKVTLLYGHSGCGKSSLINCALIPALTAAGYRCIAPDHVGFGKSDKVLDDTWYSIERHSQACAHLIRTLDLKNISLVCQDWGGPIGLRQAVDMPERFDRLTILNTWLHHEGYQYTQAILDWNAAWKEGGFMDKPQGCGFVMKFALENWRSRPLQKAKPLTIELASADGSERLRAPMIRLMPIRTRISGQKKIHGSRSRISRL